MDYRAYMKQTRQAAEVIGGEVISLAGGYYGVKLMADGTIIILALDLDSSSGWCIWREDDEGERCCDDNIVELGWHPVQNLREMAYIAAAHHRCA